MHAVEGEVCVWGGGRTVVSHTQFLLKFASPSARTRTHARASIFGHEAATAIISSGHKAATAIISSGHEAATAIISSGHVQLSIIHVGHVHNTTIPVTSNK